MAKTKRFPKTRRETDSVYMLKLVLYLVLGSFWVRFEYETGQTPLPVGFVIGTFFAARERFQIDRKIEYAILLVAMFVGFWLPLGLSILV